METNLLQSLSHAPHDSSLCTREPWRRGMRRRLFFPFGQRFCIYSFTKCSIRKGKNFFEKARKKYLLFCRNIVQYACKSNGDVFPKRFTRKYAHHFPPYHIGSALGAVRFRGRYPFFRLSSLRIYETKKGFAKAQFP